MGPGSAPISFVEPGLGNSSYLLDLGDGRAVVVDPTRDVSPYLAAADRWAHRVLPHQVEGVPPGDGSGRR